MHRAASLLVLAGGALAAATLFGDAPTAQAKPCGSRAVHAVIAGKHRCLRAGHGCVRRLDSQYHRYRFHCHGGVPVFGVLGLAPGPAFRRLEGGSRPGGYYVKMIWIGDPERFTGNFLLRGRRLDAWSVVRFSDTETPSPVAEGQMTLRRVSIPGEWREAHGPRYLRLPGPGCYGLQADGATFSTVVVFQAG